MGPPNLLFPTLLHLTSIGAESHIWYVYMSWQYASCHNTPRCFLFHGQHSLLGACCHSILRSHLLHFRFYPFRLLILMSHIYSGLHSGKHLYPVASYMVSGAMIGLTSTYGQYYWDVICNKQQHSTCVWWIKECIVCISVVCESVCVWKRMWNRRLCLQQFTALQVKCAHISFPDFKPSARYYALNILEELDSPNEVHNNITVW